MASKKKKPGPVLATAEELERFQSYLAAMGTVVARFIEEARAAGVTLDYSRESITALEPYLQNRLAAGENRESLKTLAGRYVGETFRKSIGGAWELCLKEPDYIYFKMPVISGYSAEPIEFCPDEVVGNFLAWLKPGMLERAFAAHEKHKIK
jgi:hypothetical protein